MNLRQLILERLWILVNCLVPNAEKFESESLELFLVKGFLNTEECNYLVSALKEQVDEDELPQPIKTVMFLVPNTPYSKR